MGGSEGTFRRVARRAPDVAFALTLGFACVGPAVADDVTAFEAREEGAYVFRERSRASRKLGHVEPGSPIRVRRCGPACEPTAGFVGVEPAGFMATRDLRPHVARPARPPTELARVTRRTPLRARPAADSNVIRHLRAGHSIAVLGRSLGQRFAERPDGTFLESAHLQVHRPTRFVGERDPTTTLAFALANRTLPDGTVIRRYDRFPVERYDDDVVIIRGAALPRAEFRIARRQTRPPRVPRSGYWVHVDEREQVLTAYRGDRWVLATLVTTGVFGHSTIHGTFFVYRKTRRMTMNGDAELNYLVEEVADVQFFRNGYALHAAYWHDRFGERGSHGCVNLSPADAAFLFGWSPPSLPDGWASVYLEGGRSERLWVTVE